MQPASSVKQRRLASGCHGSPTLQGKVVVHLNDLDSMIAARNFLLLLLLAKARGFQWGNGWGSSVWVWVGGWAGGPHWVVRRG